MLPQHYIGVRFRVLPIIHYLQWIRTFVTGPFPTLDRYYWTWGWRNMRRSYFNDDFHTFGLEWNDKYLWTYVDSRINQILSLRFDKKSFWERGMFPQTIVNGTGEVRLQDPWVLADNNVAPFDQSASFHPTYLIRP